MDLTAADAAPAARRRAARVPAAARGRRAMPATVPLDVTVLMGGPSEEREVSLMSGRAIADALQRLGHRVTPADVGPGDARALDRPGIEVVFIALHGEFGESGEVQELCQQRSLRYIGSGPQASRLAMNKAASKQLCRRAGLCTPDWAVLEEADPPARREGLLAGLGLPVVIKPIDGGSSLDVVIARDGPALSGALERLLDKHRRLLAERYVAGREITVGLLGDRALPVLEIIPDGEFYDYRAKYADDARTRYLFDHGLSPKVARAAQDAARKCFAVLGCRDLGRADFILDADGVPWLLEINTIPGFTSHSLLPKAARRAGISFDRMVQDLVEMALNRSAVSSRSNR